MIFFEEDGINNTIIKRTVSIKKGNNKYESIKRKK